MSHKHQREFSELVHSYANEFNLELSKTANKHWRLRDPITGKQAITSTGSGDPLAIRHARSDLRKRFGEIQGELKMKPSTITNVTVTKNDDGVLQEYPAVPEVEAKPVTTKPTSWSEAMHTVKSTSGMNNVGLAQLFGCSTTTIRGWLNGTSPNITRKDNFTDLFPNVDFSGLKWDEQRLPKAAPVKVMEKTIQQVKDAGYWANVASCAMSFLRSLDRHNIDSKDVVAFLDNWKAIKQYNELNHRGTDDRP